MKKAVYILGLLVAVVLIVISSGIRLDVPVEKLKAKYANKQSYYQTLGDFL